MTAAYIVIAAFGFGSAFMVLFAWRRTKRPSELRIGACILVVLATLVAEWWVHDLAQLPDWDGYKLNIVVH